MHNTIKTAFLLSGALLMAVAPARVAAQSFDNSGTPSLSGPYLFRYVDFFNDTSGNLTESCSLSGVITFDGAGKYTLSNTQLFDSAGLGGTGTCASLGGGAYGVQSNGIAQLDTPIFGGTAATLFGAFSKPLVIASSTEDDYYDLFLAVQAPSTSLSNSSLSGAFTVGALDFLNAPTASASGFLLARQGYFTLNADGNGNIAAFTLTGSAANLNSSNTTQQNVGASTYALSGTAGGTLTFPGTAGDPTQIVSGAKTLYASADGNWFVGGSTTGSDMIFGFHAPSGTSSNALLNGTYFTGGMEDFTASTLPLDAFYGSINTAGDGNLIFHERFDDIVDRVTYDFTGNAPVTIGADGSYYDGSTYNYFAGANGTALMVMGSGPQFALTVGIRAPSITPTSTVWIDPTYITNAANYTPITNAYAPGELVSLFGNFGVSTQSATALPIPTTLGGVQVFVNGLAAPVDYVSKNQISAWIPYEVSTTSAGLPVYFATFQVAVNGSMSNAVTVYLDKSAPGIYTLAESGLGSGAVLHADYSLVGNTPPATPAAPGETVLLYMNGLGTVTPTVADGAPASGNPLSYSDEYNAGYIFVSLDDGSGTFPQATVSFAGLAPDLAWLYQVNFALPATGLANGDVSIYFETLEGSNEMATIAVSGFPKLAAQVDTRLRTPRGRSRAAAAGAAHGRGVKNHRRALPERPPEKL
jgi:uncharacterized protein (TIGR03437 family)